jgi:hypothetical protein
MKQENHSTTPLNYFLPPNKRHLKFPADHPGEGNCFVGRKGTQSMILFVNPSVAYKMF